VQGFAVTLIAGITRFVVHGDLCRPHVLSPVAQPLAWRPDSEHLMLRILHDTNFDFIKWWRWAAGLTAAFILAGLPASPFSAG
jgi:hypothetical protein